MKKLLGSLFLMILSVVLFFIGLNIFNSTPKIDFDTNGPIQLWELMIFGPILFIISILLMIGKTKNK
jgi:hypothetical protein